MGAGVLAPLMGFEELKEDFLQSNMHLFQLMR